MVKKRTRPDKPHIITKHTNRLTEKARTGRLTVEEMAYIKKNLGTSSVEEIALNLNRSPEAIIKVRDDLFGVSHYDIRENLKNSTEWGQIKKELTKEEHGIFEEKYVKLMGQFAKDLLPTEESQIHELIRFEILVHRKMVDVKRASEQAAMLQEELFDLRKQPASEDTRAQIRYVQDQLYQTNGMSNSAMSEVRELHKRSEAILKNLKGTRDQRLKNVEERNKTLVDVIKNLEERDYKEKEGRYINLMKEATKKERLRLSKMHDYGASINKPGIIDRPILNSETVSMDDVKDSDEEPEQSGL